MGIERVFKFRRVSFLPVLCGVFCNLLCLVARNKPLDARLKPLPGYSRTT